MHFPIETPRLILREFERRDSAHVARIGMSEGFSFYALPPATSPFRELHAAACKFVDKTIALQAPDPMTGVRENYKIALALPSDPATLIGYVALDEWSEAHGEARDIGYFVDPAFQGHGFATLASALMLNGFFKETAPLNDPSYDHMKATAHPENPASLAVLRKLGFVMTGREEKIVRGKVEPRLAFTLKREAFAARLTRLLPARETLASAKAWNQGPGRVALSA